MRIVLALLVLFSSIPALAQTEVGDASARMTELHREHAGMEDLQRMADYTGGRAARLGLVANEDGLWVIARSRTRRGERIDIAQVVDAQAELGGQVRVISQRRRIFAVTYRQAPQAPDPSPCACTSPGGYQGEQWFRIHANGSVQRILSLDSGIGSATWDEAARRAVVTERHGPVRCPPGCEPAPAIQIIYTRTYELRGDRLHQLGETSETEYTG